MNVGSAVSDLLRKFNETYDYQIRPSMHGIETLTKLFCFLDMMSAFVIHGATLTDYFEYEFFRKSNAERATFITIRRQRKLFLVNNPQHRLVLDDKNEMNRIYAEFLGRDWMCPSHGTLLQFTKFCDTHPVFVVKPRFGFGGRGVYVQSVANDESIEDLYARLVKEDVVVEEIIRQHSALEVLHPDSVNTVRINTFYTEDTLNIVSAAIRIGNNGAVIDNRSGGGMAASIDVATGLVSTAAVDKRFHRYILHPLTGQQIIGIQIPFWSEILSFIENAFLVYPKCSYIGWDVAVTPQGPVLVEANGRAQVGVQQQPDQIGKWPIYKKAMKKV
ncbi:MAG: sugar-transfer associated ATP-grasp domain-containing protein [Limnochordia bacterium]|jgi:hypothetical protein